MGAIEDLNLDDAVEPKVADADEEYKLSVIAVNTGTDKNGLAYFMPTFEIEGEPFSKPFSDFFHLPNPSDMDERKLNQVKYKLKNFFEAFDVDYRGRFDPEEDLIGCSGFAILGARENDEFGEQNYIKKYIKP